MVKYFRDYSLQTSPGSKVEASVDDADMEMEELVRGFRPQEDYVDKVMLYMLTGRNRDNVMKDWLDRRDGGADFEMPQFPSQANSINDERRDSKTAPEESPLL